MYGIVSLDDIRGAIREGLSESNSEVDIENVISRLNVDFLYPENNNVERT